MPPYKAGDRVEYAVDSTWYPGYISRVDAQHFFFKYKETRFKHYCEPIDRSNPSDMGRLRINRKPLMFPPAPSRAREVAEEPPAKKAKAPTPKTKKAIRPREAKKPVLKKTPAPAPASAEVNGSEALWVCNLTNKYFPLITDDPLPTAPGEVIMRERLVALSGSQALEGALERGELAQRNKEPVIWTQDIPGTDGVPMRIAKKGRHPHGPHECVCDHDSGDMKGLRCAVVKLELDYVGPKDNRTHYLKPEVAIVCRL